MLTKSKFLAGLQCHKLVWHAINANHLIPVPDEGSQALFDQGAEVGALARTLFPTGIEIGRANVQTRLESTRAALALRVPIFEAAFIANGGYAQVDVLTPNGDEEWDVIEVKSGTSVVDVYIDDLAYQGFVLTSGGIRVRQCSLMIVNNEYARRGEIDATQLFTLINVTDQVAARSSEVGARLSEMFRVTQLPVSPAKQIGSHCDNPYACALHDHCWNFLPGGNVTEPYRGKAKAFEFLQQGMTMLAEIVDEDSLTDNQKVQRQVSLTGNPHVDRTAIAAFLDRLVYPLHFLDFETFATAIPLVDNARPYQQIPFQFSLDIVDAAGPAPRHHSFLAAGRSDPRQDFMARLQAVVGETGPVVFYNASFEVGRLPGVLRPDAGICGLGYGGRIAHRRSSGAISALRILPSGSAWQCLDQGSAARSDWKRLPQHRHPGRRHGFAGISAGHVGSRF